MKEKTYEKRETASGGVTVLRMADDDVYPADVCEGGQPVPARAFRYLCPELTPDEALALARSAGGLPRLPSEAIAHIVGQIDYLRPPTVDRTIAPSRDEPAAPSPMIGRDG